MIRKKILEDAGIEIPDDATRFITEGKCIVFLVPTAEEYGNNIVFEETEIEADLTEEQIEALKAANCYGQTGWTIV